MICILIHSEPVIFFQNERNDNIAPEGDGVDEKEGIQRSNDSDDGLTPEMARHIARLETFAEVFHHDRLFP